MQSPLVSIIVPVYNVAAWLPRCLDSICAQTYEPLEIICVNDGATDDSPSILADFEKRDARIRIVNRPNGGLSAARNSALECATGEWVLGVDADDYLAPDVVERAVACVGDGVDMVFVGVQMVDDEGKSLPDTLGYFALPSGVQEFSERLALNLNVCFWSKLWRRSLIEAQGLRFPDGLVHEDEAFYYLAAPFVRNVAFSPAIGYYYVQRGGSIMHSNVSVLGTARKCVSVLAFVSEHATAVHASYYLCMLWRLYKQCFHHARREERAELAAVFRAAVPPDAPADDYRVACLIENVSSWVRREPSRLVYCVRGIPVLARVFDGLRFSGWQFALCRALCARLSR